MISVRHEDSLKIEDSVNFASDSVQMKKRESEMRSSEIWKCDRKGHLSFEWPHREIRKKNRRGDAYEDRKRKHKKLQVRQSLIDVSVTNVVYQ